MTNRVRPAHRGMLAGVVASTCSALLLPAFASAAGVRVDINPETNRKDALSPEIANVHLSNGREAQFQAGPATITVRAIGDDASIEGVLWKAGYDTGATLASDGIALRGNGKLELSIAGLPAGRHTLTTFHNIGDNVNAASSIVVSHQDRRAEATPSLRAAHDDDTAFAHVAFEVTGDEPATITLAPGAQGARVVLNGIELNLADPPARANKPVPANGFEHAPEDVALTWTPSPSAREYHVYLATSRDEVESADGVDAPAFAGKTTEPTFTPADPNHMLTYFWRVDTVAADGSIARGSVWRFRTRHLAFPGAEGYGRFARGGRGGRVIAVTNLNDSGPGSLRAAIEAEGPRTVVFHVGGVIRLQSKLIIRNPYITIAGQTAPGDGIATYGYTFGLMGTHDVVIRYMRVRIGDESGSTMDGSGFASSDHSIMDHCSVAWSIDEGVSSRGAKNITFQRSIIAEALNIANHAKYRPGSGHSFAASIGGNIGSFHHNLLAHNAGRNWSLAGGLNQAGKFAGFLDIRNNVVYNWHHRTTDGGARKVNFVNNYYIPGPATREDVRHFVKAQLELKLPDDIQQYYVTGNFMEGHPDRSADNLRNGGLIFQHTTPDEERRMVLSEPFCESFITERTAKEAYESVIADVGANIPHHDTIDQRVLKDVRERSFTAIGSRGKLPGIIDSQTDVGGIPEMKSGQAPADTDGDGMPDWFEQKHNLNPNDPADGNALGAGGYTNLEIYLNWIVDNGGLEEKK